MNFEQINVPQHTQPSLLHGRVSSVSTDASGIDDLIDNVLDDIEEYQIDHEEKASHVAARKSSAIDDNSPDTTPSLPMSTTGLAQGTQPSFPTHHNNPKPPAVSNGAYTAHVNQPSHAHVQQQPAPQPMQFKVFSPNPFYPGQALPMLAQMAAQSPPGPPTKPHAPTQPQRYPSPPTLQSASSVHSAHSHHSVQSSVHSVHQATMSPRSFHQVQLSSSMKSVQSDIIKKLKKILRDKDDTGDGKLDLEEFSEAIHDFDPDVSAHDLEDIFHLFCDKTTHEISISKLIKFISKAQNDKQAPINSLASPTPKAIFRGAFPDIFSDDDDDVASHREIWGDAHSTSIHKLEEQLQEEAENEGVIDFPEFEAAINNMGIEFTKAQLKKLFAHFLGEQDVHDRKLKILKKRKKGREYEVRLAFLMELLKKTVDNHAHLKPKQILQLAFMELLMNENKLNKRSSFLKRKRSSKRMQQMLLRDHEQDEDRDSEKHDENAAADLVQVDENKAIDENEKEDSFQENPEFDQEFGAKAAVIEAEKSMSTSPPMLGAHGGGSYSKGDRNLMRMGSTAHWNDTEVQRQAQEMEDQLKMLEEQNSGVSITKSEMAMIAGNANVYSSVPQKRTFGYFQ